ncbi:MAG: NUDIX domain-containing protein [Gammaproteobacteria bacterium]
MKTRDHSHPEVGTGAIGTNVVIFTLRDRRLYLLLVNRANNTVQPEWALPGGPLRLGEDIEQSARQQLEQEAGVTGVYLEQLYTLSGGQHRSEQWGITVAHYALFPLHELGAEQTNNGDAVGWFQLDQLPRLRGNDRQIVTMAHARLAAKLEYSTIALQFLPEQFTLRELQEVYETILDQTFDKRNFIKSVLANNFIEETGEKHRNGAHRPARLYRMKSPGKVEFTKWSVTKKVLVRRAS